MSNSQLLQASFAGGLRMPHYVNGRLLYADDLKADQEATLERLRWLGQAAGYGVGEGLMVSQAGATSVQVTKGWGLNREGHVIKLPGAVTLELKPTAASAERADDAGLFVDCTFKPSGNGGAAVADGAYLLTAMPASQMDGQAPLKGGAGSNLPPGCTARWEVEGVQFKVIGLTGFNPSGATSKNRQNLLAHWCLGSEALRALPANPFDFDEDWSGLDAVPTADLTACDLPLAAFYWENGQLTFVDAWSARRPPVRPCGLEAWRGSLSDKRLAAAYARFLQFQAQAERMAATPLAGTVRGLDYFRYLPPVGFLPIRPLDSIVRALISQQAGPKAATLLAAKARSALPQAGFDLLRFFGDAMPASIGLISGESVDFYLHQSWHDEVIDLSRPSRFKVWIAKDVWLRAIAEQLYTMAASQAALSKKLLHVLRPWLAQLAALVAGGVAGADDRLYAIFVKKVEPTVYIPISEPEPPPPAPITGTITLWHSYPAGSPQAEVLQESLDRAREANPEAKIFSQLVSEMEPQLILAIAAGTSPDLVLWSNANLGSWVGQDLLLPVDEVVQADSAVLPTAYEGMSVDGTLYGVPLAIEAVAMLMNQEAGLPLPATLTELFNLAAEMGEQTALVRDPYHLYGFFRAFGGELMDADGHCTATEGGFKEALEYLRDLHDKAGTAFLPADQVISGLEEGTFLLGLGGPWYLQRLRRALGRSLVVFPIPRHEIERAQHPAQPLLGVEGFFVPSGSGNAQSAVRLALQLADATAQTAYADAAYKVPVRSDVTPQDAGLAAFRDAAGTAARYPQHPRFRFWWVPFQKLVDDVLAENANIDEALQRACQEMDAAS